MERIELRIVTLLICDLSTLLATNDLFTTLYPLRTLLRKLEKIHKDLGLA
jgi:hypothetical protein